MSQPKACRMCLSVDACMLSIIDTPLQEVYEKLTRRQLETGDGKPVMACYVCHHMLKKCRTFIEKSLRADELLQQILDSGLELTVTSISNVDSSHLRMVLTTTRSEQYQPNSPSMKNVSEVKTERDDEVTDDLIMELEEDMVMEYEEKDGKTMSHGIKPIIVAKTEPSDDSNILITSKVVENKNGPDEANVFRSRDALITSKVVENKNVPDEANVFRSTDALNACKYCEALFKSLELLEDHTKSVHLKLIDTFGVSNQKPDRPYQCELCEKAFKRAGDMEKHIRTHTGEKPYSCNQCDKAFRQKVALSRHYRTHTGERPYRCKFCDRAFGQSDSLNRHLRTHTGEKPHRCNLCGKTFSRRVYLKSHVRMHHDDEDDDDDDVIKGF